ncbi:HEPN domain-containing protein [Fontisphaera persica]|uniref:HEPN domain-containing protein n=1 Tax=Fontisphaera persica TaxID=2974023 RepID=UPI0024BF3552|nr:HEPN domain-containing protein [Fontisphaera persica]WCJ58164.1 HEPN domain-containing protein [Fontisphaera persica]
MLRKQSSENNPADWFYSAADRLKVADLAWKAEGVTQSGIELPQEAVERYLKGYLVAQGWRLRRVHDLGALLADAMQFEPRFAQFKNLADELTEDFFAQHYPGGDWTELGKNYAQLREQTHHLVELIRELLPHFFKDA